MHAWTMILRHYCYRCNLNSMFFRMYRTCSHGYLLNVCLDTEMMAKSYNIAITNFQIPVLTHNLNSNPYRNTKFNPIQFELPLIYDFAQWFNNLLSSFSTNFLLSLLPLLLEWLPPLAACDDSQIMYSTETNKDEEGKTSEKITVTTSPADKKSKKMSLSKLFRPWKWRKKRKSGGKTNVWK